MGVRETSVDAWLATGVACGPGYTGIRHLHSVALCVSPASTALRVNVAKCSSWASWTMWAPTSRTSRRVTAWSPPSTSPAARASQPPTRWRVMHDQAHAAESLLSCKRTARRMCDQPTGSGASAKQVSTIAALCGDGHRMLDSKQHGLSKPCVRGAGACTARSSCTRRAT